MNTKEFVDFISCIEDGIMTKKQIMDYAKEYFTTCGELDSLLIKMTARTISEPQIVFTGDRGDNGLEEIKDSHRITIEQQKRQDRLFEAMGIIEAYKDRLEQPQQVQTPTLLPVELQTDEAIKRFERAEKAGIIERTQTGYRKKGISKAMLAYFLQKVFLQDSRANDLFPDKELSTIFNESRLGAAVTALINNRDGKPKGYKQIDDLFVD
ncbi:MAG: hypothetical protein HG466_003255 [Prevotella sp.]|nr:hypothetical protein [Prevotella sp.]